MKSHFIISSVSGVMIAICGAAIGPRDFASASVGFKKYSDRCEVCDEKVSEAWITFVGLKERS